MGLFNDDMTGLAAAYASMNDGKYLLTNADKVGNTPAWQNRYKVNESTGEMLYEMADHLKESYEEELITQLDETLQELKRFDEGKIPAGLQAYIDKKKGGKKEKEEENGKDHGGSKGSKPDFLDLDKDGDKKEPMKKAAKEKKEGEKHAANMARKIKMSPSYAGAMGEELIKSGVFTEQEITKFLWVEFDESIEENRQVAYEPEKYKDPDESDKPYSQRSRAARMRDPKRGINSPAFKKFMADRGMSASYEPTLPMLESKKKL